MIGTSNSPHYSRAVGRNRFIAQFRSQASVDWGRPARGSSGAIKRLRPTAPRAPIRNFSKPCDIAPRALGRLRLVYGLDAIKNLAEIALRDLNVIVVLQIEPKLCSRAERLGEPKRSIGA